MTLACKYIRLWDPTFHSFRFSNHNYGLFYRFPQSMYTNESKVPIYIIIYRLVGTWFPYPRFLYMGLGKKNYVYIATFKLYMVIMRRPFSSETSFNCQTQLEIGVPRRRYICKLNFRFLYTRFCVYIYLSNMIRLNKN